MPVSPRDLFADFQATIDNRLRYEREMSALLRQDDPQLEGLQEQLKVSESRHGESLAEIDAAHAAARDATDERHAEATEEAQRARGDSLEAQHGVLAEVNETLVKASAHKSEFLSTMSHELRSPLNAVIGFAEVLLDGTYGAVTDKQRPPITGILESGRQLLALVNDLLDLSKIEAGRLEYDFAEVDIAALLERLVPAFRAQAQERGLELVVNVPGDLPGVRADAGKSLGKANVLLDRANAVTEDDVKSMAADILLKGGLRVYMHPFQPPETSYIKAPVPAATVHP